jgi:hypothetical protein
MVSQHQKLIFLSFPLQIVSAQHKNKSKNSVIQLFGSRILFFIDFSVLKKYNTVMTLRDEIKQTAQASGLDLRQPPKGCLLPLKTVARLNTKSELIGLNRNFELNKVCWELRNKVQDNGDPNPPTEPDSRLDGFHWDNLEDLPVRVMPIMVHSHRAMVEIGDHFRCMLEIPTLPGRYALDVPVQDYLDASRKEKITFKKGSVMEETVETLFKQEATKEEEVTADA